MILALAWASDGCLLFLRDWLHLPTYLVASIEHLRQQNQQHFLPIRKFPLRADSPFSTSFFRAGRIKANKPRLSASSTSIMATRSLLMAICLLAMPLASWAHTVIVYPGWRGDNLVTNATFPYGMQWMYPCKHINYQYDIYQLLFATDG